jgi:murein DD-endopeptidase MepM/ murein hydrolase activator NlpD
MNEQLHIIIASDRGKVFKLPFSIKKICIIITTTVVALLVLTVASICSFSLYKRNCTISDQLAGMQEKLKTSTELIAEHNRMTEERRQKLSQKVADLEKNNKQATTFKKEKESLLTSAIDELKERSELIERIFGNIGIKIPKTKDDNSKHSGGPFIQLPDSEKDDLLLKTDSYLKAIQRLPLGKPINNSISSGFGKRRDPINHRWAFHSGIDFRGEKGDPIHATADGVVLKAFRNGGFGNYVLIDHHNGYTSSYAHLRKYLVHKGDKVKRGQVIGLLGNTGRSTGSHLHYEISLNNKPINPTKFMKVASLAKITTSSPEKK